MEMAVKSMEMVVESMEMAPGALPRPGRAVPPKLVFDGGGVVELFWEKHQFL
jgi:hypothetical protein